MSNVAQVCVRPIALMTRQHTDAVVKYIHQEVLLRNDVPVVEWLAMIGLSGTLIGGIQFGVLEGKAVTEVDFSAADIGLIVGFVASMAIFYSLVPVLIKYVPPLLRFASLGMYAKVRFQWR